MLEYFLCISSIYHPTNHPPVHLLSQCNGDLAWWWQCPHCCGHGWASTRAGTTPGPNLEDKGCWTGSLSASSAQQCQLQCGGILQVSGINRRFSCLKNELQLLFASNDEQTLFRLLIVTVLSLSVGGMDEWQTHEVLWGQKKQSLPVQTLDTVSQFDRPGPGPQPQGGALQPAGPRVWLFQRTIHPVVWKRQKFHHPNLPHHTWNLGPLPHRQSWRKDVGSGGEASSCKVVLALIVSQYPSSPFGLSVLFMADKETSEAWRQGAGRIPRKGENEERSSEKTWTRTRVSLDLKNKKETLSEY